MFQEIGIALCLVLVLKGILPFAYPQRSRKLLALLAQLSDRQMRVMGLASMLLGTVLLYLLH